MKTFDTFLNENTDTVDKKFIQYIKDIKSEISIMDKHIKSYEKNNKNTNIDLGNIGDLNRVLDDIKEINSYIEKW